MTEFDLEALEKALSPRERGKKPATKKKEEKTSEVKRQNPNKPIFVAVDKEGKEVEPKDIKLGKSYGLKQDG